MYHCGFIFSDYVSGYIQVRHQVALGASETTYDKFNYEIYVSYARLLIQAYHTENGSFASKYFMSQVISNNRQISFREVGASHQNGVAERGFKTITNMARTMLIHASIKNPQVNITAYLCLVDINHVICIYNIIPRKTSGLSPLELWYRSSFLYTK